MFDVFLNVIKTLSVCILFFLLSAYVDFIVPFILEKACLVVCDISWSSPLLFICIVFFIALPVTTFILGIVLSPIGALVSLFELCVQKSYIAPFLCIVYGIFRIISNFKAIFLTPHVNMINCLGQGFLYYVGAIVTFGIIVYIYIQIMGKIASMHNQSDLY